jgi:type IV/VI secretion system ImpK/VasF family protein
MGYSQSIVPSERVSESPALFSQKQHPEASGMHAVQSAPMQKRRYAVNNPIVLAAKPLVSLLTIIRLSLDVANVAQLHQQVAMEVQRFTDTCQKRGASARLVDCAAYCLCAAIDEAVLSTAWGTQSLWVQQSLLSLFRSETLGGERFYIIAETLAQDPVLNIDVLELIYVLLSLGFEGRYYGDQIMLRDDVRTQLFQLIRLTRGKLQQQLSPMWQDKRSVRVRAQQRRRFARWFAAFLVIWCAGIGVSNLMAYRLVQPTLSHLAAAATISPVTAYAGLIQHDIYQRSGSAL